MQNNSHHTKGNFNYQKKKASFVIPQETYNKMVYEILGEKKIVRSDILYLLEIQDSIKSKIGELCKNYGFSEEDFFQRSKVGIRKEQKDEQALLLRNGKQYFPNLSDEDIINNMKLELHKIIKKYPVKLREYWYNGGINYTKTMKNIEEFDKNKQDYITAKEESILRNKEKGRTILKTLSEGDFKLLNSAINDALQNSNKLLISGDGNTILKFLKSKFPEIKKMHTKNALEYFSKIYFPLFDEKFSDKLEEVYPSDREIVTIGLNKGGKEICEVRGEIEIIDIVATKINEWKIELNSFIDSHSSQQKLQMGIQNLIDIYYEIFHNISIYNYNENNNWRLLGLDLQNISSNYKEKKQKCVYVLNEKEFKQKLYENAIHTVEMKQKNNTRSKNNQDIDINNIPYFGGFKNFIEFYKDYFISFLLENDPNKRIKKPGKIEILSLFGFTYNNGKTPPNRNKITIIANKKKSS